MPERIPKNTAQRTSLLFLSIITVGILATGCSGVSGPHVTTTAPVNTILETTQPTEESTPVTAAAKTPNQQTTLDPGESGFAPEPPPPLGGPTVLTPPVWDEASETSAKEAAVLILGLYARPEIATEQWQKELFPHLTLRGRQAWEKVSPEYLQVNEVSGGAVLEIDKSNPYWVWATVPTNDGAYRVQMQRLAAGEEWLGNVIGPVPATGIN